MRFFFLFILIACSSTKNSPEKDLVTVRTALEQAQMSYLKGCVESFRDLKMAPSFELCREKAITHRIELDSIMERPVEPQD